MRFLIGVLLVIGQFFLFTRCLLEKDTETGPLAGPSTETGNPAVLGKVVSSSSKPVGHAVVRLFRSPDISDDTVSFFGSHLVTTTQTDESGDFAIRDSLVAGSYNLEAVDVANNAYGLKPVVIPADNQNGTDADSIIVRGPGSIKGVVTRGGVLNSQSNKEVQDAFISVKLLELDRDYVTRTDGAYELKNIPAGQYTLAFHAPDGFLTAFRDSIIVQSEGVVTMDTVTLARGAGLPARPFGFRAVLDSAALIVTLTWEPVKLDSLEGYIVERREFKYEKGQLFFVKDTIYQDTVSSFVSGTSLYYLVRTLNAIGLTESTSAGPLTITIP